MGSTSDITRAHPSGFLHPVKISRSVLPSISGFTSFAAGGLFGSVFPKSLLKNDI